MLEIEYTSHNGLVHIELCATSKCTSQAHFVTAQYQQLRLDQLLLGFCFVGEDLRRAPSTLLRFVRIAVPVRLNRNVTLTPEELSNSDSLCSSLEIVSTT